MYRETEGDLGYLDLKENLELLFEDQRYASLGLFLFLFLFSVCERVKVNLMHNQLMIEMGVLAVSTLMNYVECKKMLFPF